MGSRIQFRDDYDATVLRALAKRSRDSRQIRRLLALAVVGTRDWAQVGQ